ncbi:uncharacterized protein V1510DRAFT_231991 [Dipodascopsis tothii]|uniref:uncharacterized protein n=1 Tax=Dipodascopsis tothii TaxID=44089 RepID=UPI0034CF4EF3
MSWINAPISSEPPKSKGSPVALLHNVLPLHAQNLLALVVYGVLFKFLPRVFYSCGLISIAILVYYRLSPRKLQQNLKAHFNGSVFAKFEKPKGGMVVFRIGAKFHTPLGATDPDARYIGDGFVRMMRDLQTHRDRFGLLGIDALTGIEDANLNSINTIIYFENMDGLHKFAHDPEYGHPAITARFLREYAADPIKGKKVGIYHESFQTSSFETIYKNMPPTGLGTSYEKLDSGEYRSVLAEISKDSRNAATRLAAQLKANQANKAG